MPLVFLFALVLILLAVPHATAQTPPSATLSVPSDAGLSEGDGATTVVVTATLSAVRGAATVIDLSLGGSAKATDYTVVQLPDITVAAGQTVGTANLILRPVDDGFFEGPETVRIGGAATGITVRGSDIDLEDNDKAPKLAVSSSRSSTVREGGTYTFSITVSLVGGGVFEEEEAVVLSLIDSDMESGDIDYGTTPPPWQVSIPAGATSATMDLTIIVVDDDDPESAEGANVQASLTVGGRRLTGSTSFVLIVDSDSSSIAARVLCEKTAAYVGETLRCTPVIGNGPTSREYTLTVTFGAGLALPNPLVFTIPRGSNGSVSNASKNIVVSEGAKGGSLTPRAAIAPNDRGETAYFPGLNVHEGVDSDFELSKIEQHSRSLGVRIVKWDVITFMVRAPAPVEVFGGQMKMELELDSGIVWADCTNRLSIASLSTQCIYTVGPGDYDFDEQIVVPAGAVKFTNWRERRDPTVTGTVVQPLPAARRIINISETFIYGGSHAIDLRVSPQSVQEGTGETALTITAQIVSRLASDSALVIPLKLTDISTNSGDYTVSGPLSVTIPAGEFEGSTTAIRLTPTGDARRETRVETLRIGGPPGSATTPFVRWADLNIIDAPSIALSVSPTAIAENGGAQQVTVTARWGDAGASAVPTDTVVALAWGGTAGVGDYARSGGDSVTIPANARSGSATVTITPTDDRLLEGDESIGILGSALGHSVTAAEVTLQDNETVPAVSLAVDTDSVPEGGGVRTVTVSATLDPEVAMANDVTTVTLSLSGTAVQGTDYTRTWSPAAPTISIPVNTTEGSNTVSLTLRPNDDLEAEGDETIVVQGTATTSARRLVVKVATVTLEDDDERGVNLLPETVTVTEGGNATYEVWLGSQPTDEVAVSLASTDALIANTNPLELTFSTSSWSTRQTVTVSGVEDLRANVDGKRSAEIRHITTGGGYDGVGAAVLAVTVEDNDGVPSLVVTPDAVTVDEADDPTTPSIAEHKASYTVKLATEPSATVTVAITGHAGSDLTLDKASLTFAVASWETAQTVTVTAGEDDDAVDDEVTLAHTASGGDYGSVTEDLPVTVDDDDTVGLVVDPTAVTVDEADDPATESIAEHKATYTVKLATEPTAEVTVAITGHAGSDLTLDKASLTFTALTWGTAQTVTVTAAGDDDAVDDEVTLAHTASGGDYGSVTEDLPVTVEDGDTVGLVVAPDAVTVAEGGSASYTVKLASEPSATVTVAVTGHAGSDLTLDKASLTFTASTWETAQTVTVTAGEDDDAVDDEVTLAHTASGGDYGSVTEDLPVTVEDGDTVGLVVAPVSMTVDEADDPTTPSIAEHKATYTVKLASEPTGTVTVAISGQASTDVSLDTTSLEFTTTNWSEAQTVTVTAAEDDDAVDDEVTLAHTASGGDYGSVTEDLPVTVEDGDTVGLVVAPDAVTVDEADDSATPSIAEHKATYTVKLATEPSATVTVAISGQASTDVSLDTTSLEFTTTNWSEAQTVTVTAAEDDDAVDDEVTLAHTASGGDYGSVTEDLPVTVEDGDTVGLVVDPTAVTVDEADDPATLSIAEHQASYTVKLASEPTAEVTVAITGHAGSDLTLDKASLTFTALTWGTAQTVTVTAGEDDDAVDDEVTLAHTASGGDYGSVTANVVVTVADGDTVGLVVDPVSATVDEADDSATPSIAEHKATYTVKLATEPSATVTVAVTGHAGSDLTLDKASLTFAVAKWNEAQTVTVTAVEDDDAVDDEVTLAHTASGGDYGSVTEDLPVTVDDDDTAGLVVAPDAVTVAEGGSASYTVKLATEPSATVTVAVTGHAGSDLTLDKATLTFTASTWGTAQTVTVTAGEDDDAVDDEVTLAHTASGGDYGSVTEDLPVTVADGDTVGLVVDPTAVTVDEADDPETPSIAEHKATYTVKLASEPTGTVTVAISISGQASTDVSLDTTSLEFTTTNWNEAQTVTVTAGEDDDAVDDEVTLAHTASGGDYGSVTEDLPVTVEDGDTVGLVVDPASVTVDEADDPETESIAEHKATYTVKLATEPSATVTVAISGQASTDVSLDTTSLEFTTTNWNEAQTVTVTAAEDDDAVDDEVTLAHTASGGDYGSVTEDLPVTVEDGDTVGLVVDPTAVTVDEADDPATLSIAEHQASYTVKLASEPTAEVTVAITGHAGSDLTLDKASLTFTALTWGTAQTVTVTAGEDDDAVDDEVTLAHTASGGDYGSVTANVVVTVADGDTVGLVVDPASVTVAEDGSASYTVKLATEPSATVTVAVTGHAGSDLTLDKATLTFTASTWETAQTVTVTAVEDDDAADDEVTLAHTASGGDYGSVTEDLPVTVEDGDTVGLVVDPTAVTVDEADDPTTPSIAEHKATYTVKLATEPSATVTVAITGHAGSELTLDKASLTFTALTWETAQTVTVTAAEDDDAVDDEVTLAHTASGGDYGSVTEDLPVTVDDDDTVGLVVAPDAVTVDEADDPATESIAEHKATYTVKLATEPTAEVTVAITGHAGSELTLDKASLTFTALTWETAQTVTVTAAEDDDAVDDEVTLAHTASGGDYGSVTEDLPVTVDDDDTVGLVVAPDAVTVDEADDPATESIAEHKATYTVKLATEPTAEVTVAITGHAGSDLTLDKASLTFTALTWGTAQTVTVTAAGDDDAVDDEVTLAHTASGGDYGSVTEDLPVTVDDGDTVGLVVAPDAVTVAEGGSASYTVKLATEPSATVTVAVTGHAGSDLTLDKASLTFAVASWETAQTVTVTAVEDDDAVDDEVTLAHTASGGDYGSVTEDLPVTVADGDTVGLVVDPTAVTVDEADDPATPSIAEHKATYTVKLATEPTGTVTVAISGQASTDVSLDTTSLEFTTTNWNEAQTVTVTAGEDDDAVDDEVTLAHTASGGDYGSVTEDLPVTVEDGDTVGLVVAPDAVTVDEADDSATPSIAEHKATYTVKLATEPSATVTVAVTGHAGTDLTLDKASLTFTALTWETAQTVTVTAAEDDDAVDDEVTLAHTASGGDYGSVTEDLPVTVDDDDTVGLVVDPTAVTVDEADDPATLSIAEHKATYTVKLATEPSATVTVAITGHAGSDLTLDKASLTFAVASWETAQTVTVTAAEDDDAVDDEVTLAHTASGGDYGSVTEDLPVTVEDGDTVGLVVAPDAVTVDEADDSATPSIAEHQATYTVKLATEPSATVTVGIAGHSGTDLTLDTTSLEFTTTNWNEAQTVTVTAAEDDDAVDDEVTLAHTASGGDYGSVTEDLPVTVEDGDTVGLVVDPTAVTVDEADDPATLSIAEHQASYTVKLATEPTAEVTVAITGHAGSDLTLDKASLTFTALTWGTAQTVTVTAGEDDDAVDDEVTLAHTASGGDYGSVTEDLPVTVEDGDTVGLVVAPDAVTVDEADDPATLSIAEHKATYTVKLATEPSATVTVAVTGHAGSDLTLDKASLTFTALTWGTAQTVTVTAAEDDDAVDDEVTLAHTASGGDYGSVTEDLPVTVDDDDTVGLVVAPDAVTVDEADDSATPSIAEHKATYTVKLATEPSATVTVAVTGHAGTDLTLDKASLTFTALTWETAQTVTVTAGEDDDAVDDEVTLAHTASGGDYGSVTEDLPVTVEDGDTVGLVVAPDAVTVDEADDSATPSIAEHKATYTVKLATEPTGTVTVAISGQASTDVSLDTTSLEFTTTNWNEAQTVTVTAGEDDDAVDDEVTLAHTASGGDYGSVTEDLPVTVEDGDTVGLVVAPDAVTVDEADDSATPSIAEHKATYTVKLATEPSATVTVAVTGHAGTDLTLDKASLTFTALTWETAQTVTVTAAEDDDAVDDEVTLAHTASGGDYGSVTEDLPVTVDDDDTVGLVVDPTAVTVDEADDPATLSIAEHKATYTVKLATEPSATVTVAITGHAGSDLTLDKASLTFAVASWETAQTVTVTAAEDDDAVDDEVTLAHTASGGDYGSVTEDLPVTVEDGDTVGLVVAPDAVTVDEADDSATPSIAEHQATYTVKLATEPSATVTVGIAGHSGTDLTLDTTSLEFTTTNWNEAQTVTVTAAEDDDAVDDEVTLAHTASGGDYGSVTEDLPVTVEDGDTVGLVVDPTAVTVDEADDPATLSIAEHQASYTVKLATEPTAEVTVAITGHAGSDLTLDKASLTFTALTWGTAQTVTVTAGEDDDAVDDEVTLAHTASGGDYGSVTEDLPVTVEDGDTVGLVVAPDAVTVDEADDPATLSIAEHKATYTVKLATEPSATVTVAVTGHAGSDLTLDKASLTFTALTWGTAQTVTVTAAEDDDAVDDEVTLAHTASGGDYGSVTEDLPVTVDDDDTVGLVVAPDAVTVDEADDSATPSIAEHKATYTVKLATEPSATVTVAVTGHAGTDLTLDKASLTFTALTWETAQTVTVTAGEDDDAVDDEVTLAHTASGGDYGSVTEDLPVTVEDGDTVGLVVAPDAVTVDEADDSATPSIAEHKATYTVKLATEPSATVTVGIAGHSGTDLTLDKESLTFTASTWETAQTVTVTAVEDDDAVDDEVTLAHAASGGDYGSVTANVVVTVQDDDTVGLVFDRAAVSVDEADDPDTPSAAEHQATYTVKLATEPSATVTVTISGHASSDVSLDTTSLEFTVAKWNEAQTVTVTASEDDDAADDEVTLAHTASGGGYGSVTADVVVTVEDDDEAPTGITLRAAPDRVTENGGAQTITVTATVNGATRYAETKTVTVSVGGGTAASAADYVAVASFDITIAGGAGSASGSFTLTPVDDAVDEQDETIGVTGVSGALTITPETITIVDDDNAPPALVVTPSSLKVGEGTDAKYTVALATEPSAAVTVGIAGHGGTDLSVDETSLTFTASSWETAQTVTVTAAEDDDAADDEVTLAHTASGGDYGSVTEDLPVTVEDDDEAPTGITLRAAPDRVSENGGAQTITVTAAVNGATRYAETKTVTVSVGGGTAASAADYAAVANFDITIAGGAGSASGSFTLTPVDDAVDEQDETIGVTGVSGTLTITSETITIVDDDTVGLVVRPSSLTVGEGASETYTVKLATEPTAAVTVGVAGHAGTDVGVDKEALTFTVATWNEAQTVTVTAVEDDDAADEEVTLRHTASGGDYGSVRADVEVTVDDDDTVGLVVRPSSLTVGEGASETYTVKLATEPTAAVTVGVAGHAGTDVGVDKESLTFTVANWNEAQTVTVTAAEDDDAADEEVTLAHTASGGDYGSVTADVVVTVEDDDTVGLVIDPTAMTVAEGGSRTYAVKLATEPSGTVAVGIAGHAGTDLTLDQESLTFTASSWRTAQTVAVTAGEDSDAANDTATLTHTASGGDYAGVRKDLPVTVEDDDERSTEVHLRLDPASVSEGAEPTEVTVTAALNAATLPTDVVVEVTVSPDSAGAEDFAAVRPFALTIGAGATGSTAAFTFAPVDDVFDEPEETVAVSGRITAPPDSALTVRPAVLTIVDDDETPEISIADAGAVESAGRIVFPVRLSGASAHTITVSYRTADGTAEAGADYEAGAGELSFAPGESERSVTIAVIDDALDEADETFVVQLGEAEHATVADGQATGVITDDDQAPGITIEDATVVESSGGIGFVVTLDAPSGRPISVVCRSADGTAIAGDDYVEEVGVLRFEPGERQKTIRMELIDDALDEGDEQFLLNLSEPVNVRLAAEVVSAVGTIEDDDAAVTVAWLARFGRTVTQQVLAAVGERTQGGAAAGSQVSLAGHRVSADALVVGGGEEEGEPAVLSGRSGDYRTMDGREFLAASSFLVAMEPEADGVAEEGAEGLRWTVWGRGAAAGFEGLDEDGRLSIDGSVLTGLAGVDADLGGWLGGLAVGRSDGNGGYGWAADAERPAREGDLEAELTSVYPYVRVPVTDWLSVWGVFGYGIGELRQVEDVRLEEQTTIGMLLGALGGRGELLSVGGVELAVKADGYLLRMTSESTPVLPMVEADVRRLRVTAEGSGQVRLGSGLMVRPSVEVGVRHDGGDVENGTGVELGGGLSLADLGIGLVLSGTARVLVTHEDRGYREWGAAGSLSFDPGAPGRGLAVKVDSSYGAAAGGVEQLWSQGAADLGGAAVPVGRVGAQVGYGVAQSDWSVRPYAGVELAGDSPEWRVGTRFGLGSQDVTVEGSGTTGSAALADSNLTIQYSARW